MTGNEQRIKRIRGRQVWDSRGRPTVEAEIQCVDGTIGRAIAPAGASTGSGEAVDLRDGKTQDGGLGVTRAVDNINTIIGPALSGRSIADQKELDQCLIDLDGTPNKSRLGGNTTIAVSMAALHAAANTLDLAIWEYLLEQQPAILPLPEIQIFGGGAHAGGRIDIQDFMVVPVGARTFSEALSWVAAVYHAAGTRMKRAGKLVGVADEGGYWPSFDTNEEALEFLLRAIEDTGHAPGDDVAISIDVAATEFHRNGRYQLALESHDLDSDALSELLIGWVDRYPIVSVEDPLAEDDHAGMQRFTAAVGHRIQVIGDDYLVTNADRVIQASQMNACNALLVKPNQAGTVTEPYAALVAAQQADFGIIASARSGETEDVTIAHLSVGWNTGQLKVGSFARSERMAKWNELLRIAARLGDKASFAGAGALERNKR